MARQWASWHVDFVKVDCIAAHPYKGREIAMIARAIRRSGRPILLSLSPGAAPLSHAIQFQKFAQMWRIADDFWDHWGKIPQIPWSQSLYGQFINLAAWQPFAGPGHWPDADMLPIGWLGPHPGLGPPRQSHFTRPEVRTLLTLWAMGRSPLIMGGNLLHLSPWLLRQLTNRAVIAVDQHTFDNHALITTAGRAIWLARPDQGSGVYLALFNRGAQKRHSRNPGNSSVCPRPHTRSPISGPAAAWAAACAFTRALRRMRLCFTALLLDGMQPHAANFEPLTVEFRAQQDRERAQVEPQHQRNHRSQ